MGYFTSAVPIALTMALFLSGFGLVTVPLTVKRKQSETATDEVCHRQVISIMQVFQHKDVTGCDTGP